MAGPSSSSEDEGGSHSGSSGDEAPKLPQKVLCPLPWWGRCSGRKTWVCCGTPDSPSLSSARTHTHTHAAFPSQRPQTKTKLPQAAGPSSPQRPKTPEETKPASPGPQQMAFTNHSGCPGFQVWKGPTEPISHHSHPQQRHGPHWLASPPSWERNAPFQKGKKQQQPRNNFPL